MAKNNKGQTIQVPLGALVLEVLGTALMVIGLAKKFGGMDLLPLLTQFDQSGWLLFGVGFLLTLPFVLHMIASARNRA